MNMKTQIFVLFFLLFFSFTGSDGKEIKVTTWNIEHLGSDGRGLGGIGAGNLGHRTDDQLREEKPARKR